MNKLVSMRRGGELHGTLRAKLYDLVTPGVTPLDVEAEAMRLIQKLGAEPSFTRVPGYHWATCINVNDSCVHGIPTSTTPFLSGDVVTVDVGLYYQGFHLDGAFTKQVGRATKEGTQLVEGGNAALLATLEQVKPGNRVGYLASATEKALRAHGLSPFRELTGHGVGKELHEEPMLPNYLQGDPVKTPQLVVGQTLAIEIICTLGKPALVLEDDGWTIRTRDGKLSGVFEETVEVTSDGYSILTTPALSQVNKSGKMQA